MCACIHDFVHVQYYFALIAVAFSIMSAVTSSAWQPKCQATVSKSSFFLCCGISELPIARALKEEGMRRRRRRRRRRIEEEEEEEEGRREGGGG